ncbi:phosphoribosylformylglycinamidine cyclo-ligase [[Eubacterium] cellulosolvens]
MTGITYSDSGVDIDLGDEASSILYEAARKTWSNRHGLVGEIVSPFDDFSGVRAINVSRLPENTLMGLGFDGVGTKMELAERISQHNTIAFDLFAMVCDDAVVRGGEPVVVGSVLDVNTLGRASESYIEHIRQLAEGYVNAAKAANVAVINGELAELGARVGGFGGFNYNWSAGVIWFANKARMFTGSEINIGDYVVGLRECGIRSNGLSLVRKIFEAANGKDWHEAMLGGKSLAEIALEPSKVYSRAVVEMFGGLDKEAQAEVHGVAHITGGGIPSKLGRILKPSGLGAVLDDLFDPPEIIRYCQEHGSVPDREAYRTWNMGQGMLVVTPEPKQVMEIAKAHNIDSKVVGRITRESGIHITNKGLNAENEPKLDF